MRHLKPNGSGTADMTDTVIQRSFAGGEIAPSLYARSDQIKFQTGLKRCLNFIVRKHGGVNNRPGTVYADTVRGNVNLFRQIKFVFSTGEAYGLLLADGFMRIYASGIPVNANFAVGWANGTAYVVGDVVERTAAYYYCIKAHTSSLGSNDPPNATYWALITQGYYEVPIPWSASDLKALQYAQSGDVVFVVHPSYKPKKISRFQKGVNFLWKIEDVEFNSTVSRPTGVSITGGTGTVRARYKITTAQRDTYYESLPAVSSYETVTAISKANPCKVTVNGDRTAVIKPGDAVEVVDHTAPIVGMREIVNREYVVKTVTLAAGPTTEVELLGVDSTGYTAYVSGGFLALIEAAFDLAEPSTSDPINVSVNSFVGIECYFYKRDDRGYGFIGSSTDGKFVDKGYSVNSAELPPSATNVFSLPNTYPSVVGLSQQRLVMAASVNEPEKVWMSRIGEYLNFTTRNPLQDDDSVSFVMAAKEVSPIKHVVDLDKMVVLTHSIEWMINGDESTGSIIPTAINPKPQSYNGSSSIRPVVIDDTVIYFSDRDRTVRDLKRGIVVEDGRTGYAGKDLTVYANHLFKKKIISADFSKSDSVIRCVRDDGTLLGLTYLPEHAIWGWHRHTTDGKFMEVVSVPETERDIIYVVVERTINGATKYYLEYFADREFTDVSVDAIFVDSSFRYDGRTRPAGPITVSGGTTWGNGDILTLTDPTAPFAAGDVGNKAVVVWGYDADGEIIEELRFDIVEYTNSSTVKVNPSKTVPIEYRGAAIPQSKLAEAFKTLTSPLVNISHLNGKNLSILAEGNVISDGVNDPLYMVSSGSLTLDRPHWLVTAGLPYNSELETLGIELPGDSIKSLTGRVKRVPSVNIHVEASRGLRVGIDFNHLREIKQREFEALGEPTDLLTGVAEVGVDTAWKPDLTICIRQPDPLPLTILAIAPNVEIGG